MRPLALCLALGLAGLALGLGAAPSAQAQALALEAYAGWTWEGVQNPEASQALEASAVASEASTQGLKASAVEPRALRLEPDDLWFGRDKTLHFGVSFLLTLSGQYVLTQKIGQTDARALPVSAFGTIGVGLVKEVADSRRPVHPLFSWRDLAADAAGIAAAALVIVAL